MQSVGSAPSHKLPQTCKAPRAGAETLGLFTYRVSNRGGLAQGRRSPEGANSSR
jgi:hypothetical protein